MTMDVMGSGAAGKNLAKNLFFRSLSPSQRDHSLAILSLSPSAPSELKTSITSAISLSLSFSYPLLLADRMKPLPKKATRNVTMAALLIEEVTRQLAREYSFSRSDVSSRIESVPIKERESL